MVAKDTKFPDPFSESLIIPVENSLTGLAGPLQFMQRHAVGRDIAASKNLKVLEIGCGRQSLFSNGTDFLSNLNWEVLAIDYSSEKIQEAIAHNQNTKINYLCQSIEQLKSDEKFDLIIDSHFLHEVIDDKRRKKALETIYQLLKVDGHFWVETMIYHKNIDFAPGYFFSKQEKILYQLGHGEKEQTKPIRRIKSSLEIEFEVLQAGFVIEYFMIPQNLHFMADTMDRETSLKDPEVLQVLLKKEDL